MDDNDIIPTPTPDEGGILNEIQQATQAAANAAQNVVGQISMVAVASSDIAAWGYDPLSFRLQIQFTNGYMYIYEGISPIEFEQLALSPSKGKAFWALVRRNPIAHPFIRLA